MSLFFANTYRDPIWIAFAYYDPSCGPTNQNFRKLGWWEVGGNGTVFEAWNVDLTTVNRFAYFYAESANDGANWSGTGNAWLSVNPLSAFDQCAFESTPNAQWVDFYEIDFSWAERGSDLMIIIGPSPGQVQYGSSF